jgi:hypothetical protein
MIAKRDAAANAKLIEGKVEKPVQPKPGHSRRVLALAEADAQACCNCAKKER